MSEDSLRSVLRSIHGPLCDAACPTKWDSSKPRPHSEACQRVTKALDEASAGEEERWFPLQSVKGDPAPTRIPWSVADKAYSQYRARYGDRQSLERLAERGGFDPREMDDLYPGWRDEVEADPTSMLADDNRRMRRAGGHLVQAAMRVIHEHDGIHRLALAVKAWADAIAHEGGRPHEYTLGDLNDESTTDKRGNQVTGDDHVDRDPAGGHDARVDDADRGENEGADRSGVGSVGEATGAARVDPRDGPKVMHGQQGYCLKCEAQRMFLSSGECSHCGWDREQGSETGKWMRHIMGEHPQDGGQ